MKIKNLVLIGCLLASGQAVFAQVTSPAAAERNMTGKVVETMNASGYTYVLTDTGKKKVWAASTQFAVKVGDTVAFAADAPMENFHSKTLNRDFAVVYFTGTISVNGTAPAPPVLPPGHPATPASTAQPLPPGHPALPGKSSPAADLSLTGIKLAEGGKTIQQTYAGSTALAGKKVTVRGKVVKYNAMILGKNWLHIRDGSGSAEKHNFDLTVTTTTEAKVGDVVLVTGVLSLNKDFGSNYKFDVMLDDAKVIVEPAP